MNIHDATEQAYKNGYEQGLKDAVKHVRWLDDQYFWRCSECLEWLEVEQGTADMNFCPHCGAKMDLPEPYNPDIPRDQWEDKAKFE